jgi:phosphoribosylpyrophosphate synthetase
MIYLDTPNDSLEVQPIKPTIFPDGTSQVWKIGIEKYVETGAIIYWYYENEAEVMQLLQLKTLLEFAGVEVLYLYIPYLPYGRQDKIVSDETTFARMTFETLLEEYFEGTLIMALDIHSPSTIISDVRPVGFINHAFRDMQKNDGGEVLFRPDVILVFPDKGAKERYKAIYPDLKNYITINTTSSSFYSMKVSWIC